jgi:hypothetical protein
MRWRFRAALVLFVVALVLSLLRAPAPRPCQATFEAVREGMPRAEVYATVGGPRTDRACCTCPPILIHVRPIVAHWHGDDGSVLTVNFDGDDRAEFIHFLPPRQPSFWQSVRDRLGV